MSKQDKIVKNQIFNIIFSKTLSETQLIQFAWYCAALAAMRKDVYSPNVTELVRNISSFKGNILQLTSLVWIAACQSIENEPKHIMSREREQQLKFILKITGKI